MAENINEQIEKRAFEIWEFRQEHGMKYMVDRLNNEREITAEDDWFQAKQEVLEKLGLSYTREDEA